MPGDDSALSELDSRRAIYRTVEERPGIHFSALRDELEYAQGTIQYHLRRLEADGLIEESQDGKYTRYYPAESFDAADREAMNALRRTYSRRILATLIAEGPQTTSALADALKKSPSTVSWHLSHLEDAGLVTKERDGRAVYYDVSDPERVKYLYTVHQRSFTDRVVDRLLGLWDAY